MTSTASLKWQSDYTRLKKKDKEVIDKHLALSAKLDKWDETRAHLIEEFHQKKFTSKKRSYKAKDEETDKVYGMLFMGKKKISSFDVFPCEFQSLLENLLQKEIGSRQSEPINLMSIYYGGEKERERKSQLDEAEWVLEECEEMTESDKEVINRFREGFIELFDEVIALLVKDRIESHTLATEKKRILKHLVPVL